jgi:hypothetical protein
MKNSLKLLKCKPKLFCSIFFIPDARLWLVGTNVCFMAGFMELIWQK